MIFRRRAGGFLWHNSLLHSGKEVKLAVNNRLVYYSIY
ncbi:MAG: hypothetical protein ACI8XU_001097, partial [Kiritimatiellia bacterium]